MTTGTTPMDEWKHIPWKPIERNVFKLQKRIYQASLKNDRKKVHRLQKLLMKSRSGRLLAVRRVTQDNQGKKTAGIDGVKSLTPKQRLHLSTSLKVDGKASPLRRVEIPKPGTSETRKLGIPTMHDRALQALVKQALEPEWEARFEANSYGFRPGRSCHDAINAICASVNQQAKWCYDADIAKCFDRIAHEPLLAKVQTSPTLRRQLRSATCSLVAGECAKQPEPKLSAITRGRQDRANEVVRRRNMNSTYRLGTSIPSHVLR